MKKIMVTGGAGFVGSHLIERLLEDGNEVYCFDFASLETSNNLREVKNNPNLHYFQGDIRSREDIKKFWVDDAACVYHLASVVGIKNYIADPLKLVDIVVIGTRNLLEEAARTNTKVVFSSTSEIFAKNPAVPWNEDGDRVLGPTYVDRWSYSSSKAVCEHMLYGMGKAKSLPFTIARFFNVYGARQNQYFVVSQTIYKILRGEKPLMYDGGEMTRCFTYVGDIIDGLMILAENEKAVGEAFNLGNPVEISVKKVIEIALKLAKSDMGYEDVDTGKLYGKSYEDIIRRVPDVSKARDILGWSAKVKIEDGLRYTIEWAKQNPWYLA